MEEHYITWWNVENLFDVKNSKRRPEWLEQNLKKELKSWTLELLNIKLENLTWAMSQMNNGQGSDIYGVCEIENLFVLEMLVDKLKDKLPQSDYRIIHHNTDDKRGIDIGVIYNASKYKIKQLNGKNKVFTYRISKRTPTRDILQVEFVTRKGNDIVVLLNHWYSRISGKYESEPFRIISAETLSYWIMRIQEELGENTPILVMGDFNDEPSDRSLIDSALSTNSKSRVFGSKKPFLYNLMWELMGKRKGTYALGASSWMLDQFLVSKGMLKLDSKIKVDASSVKLDIFDKMVYGNNKNPIKFRKSRSRFNVKGFSDHFPISVKLIEP